MFQFPTPTAVTLDHVNLRAEKHGDESAAAIDLKFTREAGNDILDLFHPKLRESLYFRSAETEAQGDIEGVPKVLPNLLFSRLQPLAWELEHTGAKVVIDYGLGDDSNVELHDCKLNAFRIAPKEGGTVAVTFRVQTSTIPDGALDKLSGLLQRETQITLTLPEVKAEPKQAPIDGTEGHPALSKSEKKRKAAQQGDADPSGSTEPWPFPKTEKTPEQALAESVGAAQ